MKILCINYEYPPLGGGGGVVCKGLAEALVNMGHEIDIVTSGMRGLPSYEEIEGVRVHRSKCIRRVSHYVSIPEMFTQLFPAYYKALELIRKNDYDINHTHFIVPSGIVSYMLWKKTGLPYLITAHGSDIPGYNPDRFKFMHKLILFIWKRIVNDSKVIIAPSHFLKDLIHKRIDTEVEIIANGYNLPNITPVMKKNHILVVSRMFERKGVQYFLEAISNFKDDWEIFIAGDGPYMPKLKSMAQKIEHNINFTGFIRQDELVNLYNSAKIFVFPSIRENFPVVLLEAMSAGCAVITTSVEGCAEVVGDAAIKTKPKSASDIRVALKLFMSNKEEMQRMAGLSKARATQFSWHNISARYDKLLRRYYSG